MDLEPARTITFMMVHQCLTSRGLSGSSQPKSLIMNHTRDSTLCRIVAIWAGVAAYVRPRSDTDDMSAPVLLDNGLHIMGSYRGGPFRPSPYKSDARTEAWHQNLWPHTPVASILQYTRLCLRGCYPHLGYGLLFLPNKHSFVPDLKNLKIVRQQRTTGDYYASRR